MCVAHQCTPPLWLGNFQSPPLMAGPDSGGNPGREGLIAGRTFTGQGLINCFRWLSAGHS
jgi:hypothetical protein